MSLHGRERPYSPWCERRLDSPLRGLERYEGAPAAEIRGATRRALENLAELAIAESVALVLLARDLYDGD